MPKRIKLGLALLAVLAVFLSLTLFFWDFTRDTLVIPLYYLLWTGSRFFYSIPEQVFLFLLVGISVWIGLNTVGHLPGRAVPEQREHADPAGGSRYRYWKKLCQGLSSRELVRRDLVFETRQLVLAVLAFQEGMDLAGVERGVAGQTLVVPETVRHLIVSRDLVAAAPGGKRMGRASRILQGLFRRSAPPTAGVLDGQIRESLEFLETRLEMPHE
jgi:hypothetical protein